MWFEGHDRQVLTQELRSVAPAVELASATLSGAIRRRQQGEGSELRKTFAAGGLRKRDQERPFVSAWGGMVDMRTTNSVASSLRFVEGCLPSASCSRTRVAS